MSLVQWNPFNSRWPTLFEEEFGNFFTNASNNLDVYETEDEVVVKANVAGVKAEDVDITIERGMLWVKAHRQEEEKDTEKGRNYHRQSSWDYRYSINIPDTVDLQKEPAAEVENGVLTIHLEKSEATKPRKLAVKAKNI